jgi:coiled-coil domain-containing protein 63/114
LRLNRWTQNNREKKHLSDMYMRNVKVIEDSFNQITETTGIKNIEEIVTTFIKTEEQNYSLYNYVNMLNTEIDTIDEQNKIIAGHIKRHEELKRMSLTQKEQMKTGLKSQIAEIKRQMGEKEGQISGIIKGLE